MKTNDHEAYVCLGDNEVRVGDRIAFFKSDCRPKVSLRPEDAPRSPCAKIKLGEGHVTKLINEHYSLVELNSQFEFNEGAIVETF